ncbi:TetR/AcrR family transcriptional regulator [Alteribacter natronophilus]|uniref:TetR/AcrR family transcriptional regulator n=1 Tax=Alteribacter natronophilus TaxID=2583810 RepID=UPI0014868FC2|nr:TetR/AcrR family transcriptional regulator [Alteribacter natronophilus]
MKEDRRIKRTREKIRETFALLIEEKGLDAVTVKDLTERADFNRGTFYLHYQDKYDLLEKSEEEVIRGITAISDSIGYNDPSSWADSARMHPSATAYFEFLKQHGNFLKAVMGPKGDPSFQDKLKKLMIGNIKKAAGGKTLPHGDYIMAFMVSAHLGVVQHWLDTGMKETPEQMAGLLTAMNKYGPLKSGGLTS